MDPNDVVAHVKAVHDRERAMIEKIDEEAARAPSTLPGWTRGHVLSCRLAFLRAAQRQVRYALADQVMDFYDGGRQGREAEIEAHANDPADRLVAEVTRETAELDETWARLDPGNWQRRANYRDPWTIVGVLYGSWREAEIHCVDYDLGRVPTNWSPQFCAHLFEFLRPRVPEGIQLDLVVPGGGHWTISSGAAVTVTGALTDLAAWMAGRTPQGAVESSTGELPALQRLRGSA